MDAISVLETEMLDEYPTAHAKIAGVLSAGQSRDAGW